MALTFNVNFMDSDLLDLRQEIHMSIHDRFIEHLNKAKGPDEDLDNGQLVYTIDLNAFNEKSRKITFNVNFQKVTYKPKK